MAHVPLLLNALYRTLEWLNDPPPEPHSPPPRAQTHGGAPGRLTARHTPPNSARPPPTTLPPPLPDKVAHKPPKRPRPPSLAAQPKARKHARQPPRPVPPLSLRRTTASQSHPEPPSPKRPLTIWDMFNVLPPPRPAPPLATSAPASTPPPRITRYFAPALPPREHKLTIVLTFIQRVISLKQPHLHASLPPALDSPNTVQAISTTRLALTSRFCK